MFEEDKYCMLITHSPLITYYYRKLDPMDQVIDCGSRAPAHIGQIAGEVTEWEGPLSDGLELSSTDVEDIKNKHRYSLKLQT